MLLHDKALQPTPFGGGADGSGEPPRGAAEFTRQTSIVRCNTFY